MYLGFILFDLIDDLFSLLSNLFLLFFKIAIPVIVIGYILSFVFAIKSKKDEVKTKKEQELKDDEIIQRMRTQADIYINKFLPLEDYKNLDELFKLEDELLIQIILSNLITNTINDDYESFFLIVKYLVEEKKMTLYKFNYDDNELTKKYYFKGGEIPISISINLLYVLFICYKEGLGTKKDTDKVIELQNQLIDTISIINNNYESWWLNQVYFKDVIQYKELNQDSPFMKVNHLYIHPTSLWKCFRDSYYYRDTFSQYLQKFPKDYRSSISMKSFFLEEEKYIENHIENVLYCEDIILSTLLGIDMNTSYEQQEQLYLSLQDTLQQKHINDDYLNYHIYYHLYICGKKLNRDTFRDYEYKAKLILREDYQLGIEINSDYNKDVHLYLGERLNYFENITKEIRNQCNTKQYIKFFKEDGIILPQEKAMIIAKEHENDSIEEIRELAKKYEHNDNIQVYFARELHDLAIQKGDELSKLGYCKDCLCYEIIFKREGLLYKDKIFQYLNSLLNNSDIEEDSLKEVHYLLMMYYRNESPRKELQLPYSNLDYAFDHAIEYMKLTFNDIDKRNMCYKAKTDMDALIKITVDPMCTRWHDEVNETLRLYGKIKLLDENTKIKNDANGLFYQLYIYRGKNFGLSLFEPYPHIDIMFKFAYQYTKLTLPDCEEWQNIQLKNYEPIYTAGRLAWIYESQKAGMLKLDINDLDVRYHIEKSDILFETCKLMQIAIYEKLANEGNTEAMIELTDKYNAIGNKSKIKYWLDKAIEKNVVYALTLKATEYADLYCLSSDEKQELLHKAASQGDYVASMELDTQAIHEQMIQNNLKQFQQMLHADSKTTNSDIRSSFYFAATDIPDMIYNQYGRKLRRINTSTDYVEYYDETSGESISISNTDIGMAGTNAKNSDGYFYW